MERTLVLIKPDGIALGLREEIIKRLEDKGLKIISRKMVQVDKKLAEEHYTEHKDKDFFPELINFITSGPVFAMIVMGNDAITKVRQLVGATKPSEALPGTIRGDYAQETQKWGEGKKYGITNLVHASDKKLGSAEREIALWFEPSEIPS